MKKSPWSISHVNIGLKTNIPKMSSISETLVFNSTLTWLLSQEDCNIFVCHKNGLCGQIYYHLSFTLISVITGSDLKLFLVPPVQNVIDIQPVVWDEICWHRHVNTIIPYAGFSVLTLVIMKNPIFWNTVQCSPLKSQPTFWKAMLYKFSSLGKQYHKNVHSIFVVSCEVLR